MRPVKVKEGEYVAFIENNRLYVESPLRENDYDPAREFFASSDLKNVTHILYSDGTASASYRKVTNLKIPRSKVSDSFAVIYEWALKYLKLKPSDLIAEDVRPKDVKGLDKKIAIMIAKYAPPEPKES